MNMNEKKFFGKMDDAIEALKKGVVRPSPEEALDYMLEALEDLREAMGYLGKRGGHGNNK